MKKPLVIASVVAGLSQQVLADNRDLTVASSDVKDRVSQVVPNTSVSYLAWCEQNKNLCSNLGNVQSPNISSKGNNYSGAKKLSYSMTEPKLNINGSQSNLGGVISLDGQTIYLGFENISGEDIILKAEYKYVGKDYGTLITFKSGKETKSVFVTGRYNGLDFTLKTTAGYLEKDYKGLNVGQAFLGIEGEKKIDANFSVGGDLSITNTGSGELPGTKSTITDTSVVSNETHIVTTTTETSKWQEFAGDKNRLRGGFSINYLTDNGKDKFKLGLGGNNGTDRGSYGNFNYSHISSDGKSKLSTDLTSNKSIRVVFEQIISNTGATIRAYIGKVSGKTIAGLGLIIPLGKAPSIFTHSKPGNDNNVSHVTGADEASVKLFGKEVSRQEVKTTEVVEVIKPQEVQNITYNISNGIATFTFDSRKGFAYYSIVNGVESRLSNNERVESKLSAANNSNGSKITFTVDVTMPGRYTIGIYELNPYDNSKSNVKNTTIVTLDKSVLNSTIVKAQSLNKSLYTLTSWTLLENALNKAISINNSSESSQEEVNQANVDLTNAINSLVFVGNKTLLNGNITKAKGLKESTYTSSSWSLLQVALSKAITVSNNPDAIQSEVDTANDSLISALNGLVIAPVDVLPTSSFGSGSITKTVGDGTFTNTFTTNSPGAVTYSSSNPAVATVNASTGLVTIVGAGSATITANQAAAPGFTSDTDTYSLTVNAANTAPTTPIVSGSTTVTIGDSMNLSFSSTDAEGNPITFSVLSGTIPAGTTFNSNGTLSGTTTTVGTGSFQVRASDGSLNSSPLTVNYNIEALPAQSLSITTSGPVVSGANTDNVIANNGPGDNIVFNLSINSPYTLSTSSLTFTPNVGLQTQTVDILHNGNVVGTRTISVTWE